MTLAPKEVLYLLECTIKKLNQQNNEVREHIRTNKDKDNQEAVDKIMHYLKDGLKSTTNAKEREEHQTIFFKIAPIFKKLLDKDFKIGK